MISCHAFFFGLTCLGFPPPLSIVMPMSSTKAGFAGFWMMPLRLVPACRFLPLFRSCSLRSSAMKSDQIVAIAKKIRKNAILLRENSEVS